ncbi:hypothetical protein [Microbacterium sp. NPDC056569]
MPKRRSVADTDLPAYAIDEQTASSIVDGTVEVITEGDRAYFD